MADIDPSKLQLFQFILFTKLEGAFTSALVHLGDRLGLYRAMASATAPLTTMQLAHLTQLNERWVREWAYNQAAAKLISTENEPSDPPTVQDDKFFLSPEQMVVLASEDHPAFGLGMFHSLRQTMQLLDDLPESFRTGIGQNYDSRGVEGAIGMERNFEPWTNANLLSKVLPKLDGVVDVLTKGAKIADVGCGTGGALLLMGKAFSKSNFTGYEISKYALARAAERLDRSKLTNVSFADPRDQPIPTNNSVDLVTTFDCIHDMTHPLQMMQAIRSAISDNGTWLLVDIKAHDTFTMNATQNPMAALLYGVSLMVCLSSSMSAPNGAGIGTLGLSANTAEQMAKSAGFTRFRKLDVDHAINAFYEIRP
ncbi:MAG: class I SAM-dependent methyltransferase [Actinomycetota bacterium]|nr:class I SAM-dependent methyltransferase [Actinomycetota bacterium]